MLCFIFSTRSL